MKKIIDRDVLKRQIVKKAMRLFMKKGIKAVRMDDIAHEMKMSKRTLYQIFEDKEALLLAGDDMRTEEFETLAQKQLSESDDVLEVVLINVGYTLQAIRSLSPNFLRDLNAYPKFVKRMQQRRDERLVKAVEFLDQGKAQGLFVDGIDFEIAMRAIQAWGDTLTARSEFGKYKPESLFMDTMVTYIRGFSTEKGRQRIDEFLARYTNEFTPEKAQKH